MAEPDIAPLHLDHLATPIGTALLVTDAQGALCALDWTDYRDRLDRSLHRYFKAAPLIDAAAPPSIRAALTDYFDGALDRLDDIPCAIPGTPFQQATWRALREIPAGTTLSYGGLAARIGKPAAIRAVGHANGSNPLSVVIPCHRLIGADGALTGYGGGLPRKRWLLRHEGIAIA